MLGSKLKVINLNVTEDFYSYKGTFQLCNENHCISMNLEELNDERLSEIKKIFCLEDPVDKIKREIMSQILDAANIESRNKEGKNID